MEDRKQKFTFGDKVLAGPLKLPLMVYDSEDCVGGVRYKLVFYKKDGTRNLRKNFRFFFEKDIQFNLEL